MLQLFWEYLGLYYMRYGIMHVFVMVGAPFFPMPSFPCLSPAGPALPFSLMSERLHCKVGFSDRQRDKAVSLSTVQPGYKDYKGVAL